MSAVTHKIRVKIPGIGAKPRENEFGIVVVGVHLSRDEVPLLLVWDEGVLNEGASATNAIEDLLLWLSTRWPEFPVRQAVVVERDSQGSFDHAYPEWSGEEPTIRPLVSWRPLRWPAAEPRSHRAFEGLFGRNAREALSVLDAMAHPRG